MSIELHDYLHFIYMGWGGCTNVPFRVVLLWCFFIYFYKGCSHPPWVVSDSATFNNHMTSVSLSLLNTSLGYCSVLKWQKPFPTEVTQAAWCTFWEPVMSHHFSFLSCMMFNIIKDKCYQKNAIQMFFLSHRLIHLHFKLLWQHILTDTHLRSQTDNLAHRWCVPFKGWLF